MPDVPRMHSYKIAIKEVNESDSKASVTNSSKSKELNSESPDASSCDLSEESLKVSDNTGFVSVVPEERKMPKTKKRS